MYIKKCDTGKMICSKTIGPTSDGRPCIISLDGLCSAWRPLMEHYNTECPECGHNITPAQLKKEGWGYCKGN